MFKLVVLFAFVAVAAAHPGFLETPVVYSTPIVQEHSLAKVGAVVQSIPTAVSHQSSTVVHNSAHVVEPIIAPVVKTYATPIVKTYAAAPVVQNIYNPYTYSAEVAPAHYSYADVAPVSYASSW